METNEHEAFHSFHHCTARTDDRPNVVTACTCLQIFQCAFPDSRMLTLLSGYSGQSTVSIKCILFVWCYLLNTNMGSPLKIVARIRRKSFGEAGIHLKLYIYNPIKY